MTLQERIVVSAYTGFLMCDFSLVHEYIEKKVGRPVFTHELPMICEKESIKEEIKKDFLKLCGND